MLHVKMTAHLNSALYYEIVFPANEAAVELERGESLTWSAIVCRLQTPFLKTGLQLQKLNTMTP